MNNNSNPEFSDKVFTWRDGKQWFDAGIVLFKQVKGHWYLSCLMLAVLIMMISSIALNLVSFVVIFASPLITAFIMNACDKSAKNNSLRFAALWQDVFSQIQNLILLGILSAIFSVISYYIHSQLLQLFNMPVELTEEMVKTMSGKEAFLRALFNIVTNLPIAMALAFSPALILFKRMQTVTAVKYSVYGVLKSWKAFLILILLFILVFMGIALLASFVVAILVAVLGAGSQTLISVVIMFFAVTAAGIGLCAQYQAFTEIFQNQEKSDDEASEVYAEI